MITRIVKMTFHFEHVEAFRRIFSESQELIGGFEGCVSVELMKDVSNNSSYFTISRWENEEYLNLYRDSDQFKQIWAMVKPLFSEKAEAWSLESQQ
jgi:quinol monooxygenase YgiN